MHSAQPSLIILSISFAALICIANYGFFKFTLLGKGVRRHIHESVINLHFAPLKSRVNDASLALPLPPPLPERVIRGESSACRSITATISMRSHDLISQTRYVRDARRLWISATRSKGFSNVEPGKREISVVRSFVHLFVLQREKRAWFDIESISPFKRR